MMKRLIWLLLLVATMLPASAQRDVTTFLGIPVDGTKAEMRRKLIAKGFVPTKLPGYDFLEGEFNGVQVRVYIVTNNNKVCRIYLADKNARDEAGIRIRFNNLVAQFEGNDRYVTLGDYKIADDTRISYEMTVDNKSFEAVFYQRADMDKVDSLAFQTQIKKEMLKEYTEEQLMNPTEEIEASRDVVVRTLAADLIMKKCVWFSICRNVGEYFIAMYYDNEYNKANGEDL